jgi:hypothetical protein
MPYDRDSIDEDDMAGDDDAAREGAKRRFVEFECPECNAYNPHDDGFGDGDEILCNYCGQELKARVNDEGRLRLKAV